MGDRKEDTREFAEVVTEDGGLTFVDIDFASFAVLTDLINCARGYLREVNYLKGENMLDVIVEGAPKHASSDVE